MRLNGTIIGILVGALVATTAGAASTPQDLCSGNPCTVTGTINVDAGSVLDFAGRDLILSTGSKLIIGAGPTPRVLTLTAKTITMAPGAQIRGFENGDLATVTLESTDGDVTMQSSGSTRSEINVKADVIDGGNIRIVSTGAAILGGRLNTSASGEDATGGTIDVQAAGNISVTQEVTSEGSGSFAGAGDISFYSTSGDILIANKVFAEGADFGGGDVTVRTDGGSITVSDLISNNGGNPDGEAGEYNLEAAVDFHLTAGAEIRGKGGAGADEDCGDGAPTYLVVGQDIIIDGLIDTKGGFQCFGGEVDATAGRDWVQNGNGKVSTATGGAFGAGGEVSIAATRSATTRQIDASSTGFGGEIIINSGLFIDVLDKLNAKATGADGIGARIVLQSCSVNVLAPDGELDSRGAFAFADFGKNTIRVSGSATLTGDMFAATENEIQHLGPPPPTLGSVDPPATYIFDPQGPPPAPAPLIPCANTCGDGSVSDPEICDDGNINSCDGCAGDCARPDDVCGDGFVECGEQCDDGNLIDGDGCESDCTPTGQNEEGVLIQGSGRKVGCQAEWLVQIATPDTTKQGVPAAKQVCIDGDTRCDADGEINSSCSVIMQPCFNVPDDDLPECDPTNRVERVILKKPLPNSKNAMDSANASSIVNSLLTLGTNVEADGAVLSAGGPIGSTLACGTPIEMVVPFSGKSGKKTFKLRTQNGSGMVGKKGQIQVKCERNTSVCGNFEVEPGETCDDGNAEACDGCFNCRTEMCGNGIVECDEQCDEGLLNGTEGVRCSATCKALAPDLRIPGGGSKGSDCMWQWSMDIGAGDVLKDKSGQGRNKQFCKDGNRLCDFDPTPGNCRVRVYGCAGGENDAIGCLAQTVDVLTLKRPKTSARRSHEIAARAEMESVFGALSSSFPANSGEICSQGMFLDIPVGEKLRMTVKTEGTNRDTDSLRLVCLP